MSGQDKRIGFYKLIGDDEFKTMVGALLVLDELGKPEEFRVTYPVKPTMIQRQLYGDSLLPHVGIELCGKPLFDTLKKPPQLLVLSHTRFLALGDLIRTPVVYLERAGESIVVSASNTGDGQNRQKMQSQSGRYDPINVTYPQSYEREQIARTASLVADFFNGIDLLEPFSRINVAIQTLRAQDERFR